VNGHAFLAPSAYERWSRCPGAPALEEHEPQSESAYSREGTEAHEWAARCLQTSFPLDQVPLNFRPGVSLYVQAIRERLAQYRAAGARSIQLLVEQKVEVGLITGEAGARGTADAILIAHFPDYAVLEVRDFKYGLGVPVSVVGNGQLQLYALAALLPLSLTLHITQVVTVIHQPRVSTLPQEASLTVEELHAFGAEATRAAQLPLKLRGSATALSHLSPSLDGQGHCQFCAVKHRCPALAGLVNDTVLAELAPEVKTAAQAAAVVHEAALKPDTEAVAAHLGAAMTRIPLIEAWCRAVKQEVYKLLLRGVAVPGWGLYAGKRGNRAWDDEGAVAALLAELKVPAAVLFAPPVLKSPSQLQEALGDLWDKVKHHVIQAPGKPTVDKAGSRKAPWVASAAAEDFADTEEEA